jgi:5-methylcytosine-specific restriction protein A
MPEPRPNSWEVEEIILACDLLMQHAGRPPSDESEPVIELSDLLRSIPPKPGSVRPANFRDPSGVRRKMYDLRQWLPGFTGAPTKGNRLDPGVVARFTAQPDVMHREAESIRRLILAGEPAGLPTDADFETDSVLEGRLVMRWHAYYEPDATLRTKKLASVRHRDGPLACEVCHVDFGARYGERGQGYIECHHVTPLHATGERPTSIHDLALLCSNCHRMIHRKVPWLTPDELRGLLRPLRVFSPRRDWTAGEASERANLYP